MGALFFVYDLLIILLCAVATSLAACAYFVSHRRALIAVGTFFVAYVLETALIFLDEYTRTKPNVTAELMDLPMTHPWLKLVLSVVLIGSVVAYALLSCRRFAWHKIAVATGLLAAGSAAALVFSPDDNARQLLFYDIRQLFSIAACIQLLLATSRAEKGAGPLAHIRHSQGLLVAALVLNLMVVAEDVTRLHFRVSWMFEELGFWLQGRNFSENALVIMLAVVAIQSCGLTLSLRFKEPPAVTEDAGVRQSAEARFVRFCEASGLTAREREILTEVLAGKDNQQIASELVISVGTVKSHVHAIFRKAQVGSRKELLQRFWAE